MRTTIDAGNWPGMAARAIDPALWTVVVPAAGRGTRLGFDRPKILYPIAGRTILEWLLDLVLPRCARVVAVLAPASAPVVEAELVRLAPGRCQIALQAEPRGMGDAVQIGAAAVTTPYTAVVWGDQVALRPESIEAVMRLHQGPLQPDVTCPTVWRRDPYIHFERDATGRIVNLLQAREGDAMPEVGESDTGFFCFRTEALRRLLADLAHIAPHGSGTGELNLLPVFPLADATEPGILTPRIMTVEETVGVNSTADAIEVEAILRRRAGRGDRT